MVLCLPSDMSSSSKRLMPMFCWLDAAVLADALSPIRSTSAELLLPDVDREDPTVSLWSAEMFGGFVKLNQA